MSVYSNKAVEAIVTANQVAWSYNMRKRASEKQTDPHTEQFGSDLIPKETSILPGEIVFRDKEDAHAVSLDSGQPTSNNLVYSSFNGKRYNPNEFMADDAFMETLSIAGVSQGTYAPESKIPQNGSIATAVSGGLSIPWISHEKIRPGQSILVRPPYLDKTDRQLANLKNYYPRNVPPTKLLPRLEVNSVDTVRGMYADLALTMLENSDDIHVGDRNKNHTMTPSTDIQYLLKETKLAEFIRCVAAAEAMGLVTVKKPPPGRDLETFFSEADLPDGSDKSKNVHDWMMEPKDTVVNGQGNLESTNSPETRAERVSKTVEFLGRTLGLNQGPSTKRNEEVSKVSRFVLKASMSEFTLHQHEDYSLTHMTTGASMSTQHTPQSTTLKKVDSATHTFMEAFIKLLANRDSHVLGVATKSAAPGGVVDVVLRIGK